MPIFFMTDSEGAFVLVHIAKISSNFADSKANSRHALAASVAYPFPHADRFNRQPISTQGVNGLS
jgi:hypothetical protein